MSTAPSTPSPQRQGNGLATGGFVVSLVGAILGLVLPVLLVELHSLRQHLGLREGLLVLLVELVVQLTTYELHDKFLPRNLQVVRLLHLLVVEAILPMVAILLLEQKLA